MSLKLNLGCGYDHRPGFVNIDARKEVTPDRVMDITSPLPFPKESVEEIIAQDILEHLTLEQLPPVLSEFFRVLQPQGRVFVRLPDIDDIYSRFAADPETRNLFIYGDTKSSGVWGAHKSGHSVLSFSTLALFCGLRLDSVRRENTNIELSFTKTAPPQLNRVAFINQTLGLGGAETFNLALLNYLKSQNINVEVWTTHPKFAEKVKQAGHKAHRIPFVIDLIGDWKGLVKGLILLPFGLAYYSCLAWINRHDTVIFMTGYIEKLLTSPAAKILRLPVVWEEFAPLSTIFSKFFGLPGFFYRLVSGLPDYLIVPSRHTRNLNVNLVNFSTARTVIIPCALDIPLHPARPQPQSVYCLSRLEPGKGQDQLLQAWPQVLRHRPQAQLYIVGEGAFLSDLQSLASRLHITPSVHFLGRVPDAISEISKAAVCVFPSLWPLEGFGLVAIEAMSQAKPLVAYSTGPIPEIVTTRTGLLVTPKDINHLAQAIVSLLTNPKLAASLGRSGRQRYLKNFTFAAIGPHYLEILRLAVCRQKAHEFLLPDRHSSSIPAAV